MQSVTPTGGGEFAVDLRLPASSFVATLARVRRSFSERDLAVDAGARTRGVNLAPRVLLALFPDDSHILIFHDSRIAIAARAPPTRCAACNSPSQFWNKF